MSCKTCKSRSLKKIINIGNQPLSSHFYSKKINKLKNYSLDLYICQKCNLGKSIVKLRILLPSTYKKITFNYFLGQYTMETPLNICVENVHKTSSLIENFISSIKCITYLYKKNGCKKGFVKSFKTQ